MRHQTMGKIAICVVTMVMAGLGVATPASAQQRYSKDISAVCNADLGQYEVTVTLTDTGGAPLTVTEAIYFWHSAVFNGPYQTSVEFPPLSVGGTTSVTGLVQGDAIYVEFQWYLTNIEDSDFIALDLDGTCSQSVSDITRAPDPTTTAEVAAVTSPRYAG